MIKKLIKKDLNVAFVCDFCFPFLGGVEIHIFNLALQLINKKYVNKIIIITHKYPGFQQKKYIENIPIYYLNLPYAKNLNIIYPTFFIPFFQIKKILLEEQINLVHCHQSTSTLMMETTIYASLLNIKVIMTQHSLFGLKDFFDLHMNKFLNVLVIFYQKVICVSRSTRNNFYIRTKIQKSKLIVIPNAIKINQLKQKIESYHLTQQYTQSNKQQIAIIFVGRLSYRRGVDLLIEIVPAFLKRYEQNKKNIKIKIIIVGDGVKMKIIKKIFTKKDIKNNIEVIGSIENKKVLQLMSKCDIYINTPLTQSFGIALVQAASLGLLCVSTQVGGITQTLPEQLLITVRPTKQFFIQGLEQAVQRVIINRDKAINLNRDKKIQFDQSQAKRLVYLYNWQNISNRVFEVYNEVENSKIKITKQYIIKNLIKKSNILSYIVCLWFIILSLISGLHDLFISYI